MVASTHGQPDRVLIALAAEAEARAVRGALGMTAHTETGGPWVLEKGPRGLDLVETGVGKAQAAGAVARVFDPRRHAGVLILGVAGALPGGGADVGQAVLASRSLFGDEGMQTPDGFVPIDEMGFAAGVFGLSGLRPPEAWADRLGPMCDTAGAVATVSCCSASDERAATLARRTGAVAEAMEGAAVAAAVCRLARPAPAFAEIRVISNTTGDRNAQRWDLSGALDRLGTIAGFLDGSVLAGTISG